MLMRFDPFRDVDRMADPRSRPSPAVLAMDAVRDEHEVTIYIDVPGVRSDDIDVSVEKNELTVSVTRRWDSEGLQILSSERPQGTFSRRIVLSDALDLDHLGASISDGVLVIRVPVAERSKPRRIDVQTDRAGEHPVDTA